MSPFLFPHPLASGTHHSTFWFYELGFFRFHKEVRSHSVCLSVSDSSCLAWCPPVSPVLSQTAEFPSFFRRSSNIPSWICTTFFSIHPWMNSGCLRILALVNNAAVNILCCSWWKFHWKLKNEIDIWCLETYLLKHSAIKTSEASEWETIAYVAVPLFPEEQAGRWKTSAWWEIVLLVLTVIF